MKRKREHKFERYRRVKGHYPLARVSVGTDDETKRVEWEITPTYLIIRTHSPARSITIPRAQLVTLLKWAIPLVKEMDTTRTFDPEAAITRYLQEEAAHDKELRELKRALYGRRTRRRRVRRGRSERA